MYWPSSADCSLLGAPRSVGTPQPVRAKFRHPRVAANTMAAIAYGSIVAPRAPLGRSRLRRAARSPAAVLIPSLSCAARRRTTRPPRVPRSLAAVSSAPPPPPRSLPFPGSRTSPRWPPASPRLPRRHHHAGELLGEIHQSRAPRALVPILVGASLGPTAVRPPR